MEECGQLLKCFVSRPEDMTNKIYNHSCFEWECLSKANLLDVSVVCADVAIAVLVVAAELSVPCKDSSRGEMWRLCALGRVQV